MSISTHEVYEVDVARSWYGLPPGIVLPLVNGERCRVVYTGQTGSAAGPDVCDAVLCFSRAEGSANVVGDVEFHVRASDWYAHRHDNDARYNAVLLHVVLLCDSDAAIRRQDGVVIPMCSLYDLPLSALPSRPAEPAAWPCHAVLAGMNKEERDRLLRRAGWLRFEQKTHAFVEMLHRAQAEGVFSAYDVCLIEALAEGLGYGRNRAFFRAAGRYLLGLAGMVSVPEPLGHTAFPATLDVQRLALLRRLVERWRKTGAWVTMRQVLLSSGEEASFSMVLQAVRAIFAGLGTARADILICNVVLPFAAAVALLERDERLAGRAQWLYSEHPGLPSNRITRAMCSQLRMESEPSNACQQQGLHYIHQQTCREKRCNLCMLGARSAI